MIICHCNRVSDKNIKKYINKKEEVSLKSVCQGTTAGAVCGCCVKAVKSVLKDTINQKNQ
jgi:bacterioferritin-associated ferredoxin